MSWNPAHIPLLLHLSSRRMTVGLIALTLFVGNTSALFTDVTAEAGVDFLHGTLATPIPSSPLYYAGGIAVTDLNNNGWLDLFVSRLNGGNLMFINQGDGTFLDEAGSRGLSGPANSNGAVFASTNPTINLYASGATTPMQTNAR